MSGKNRTVYWVAGCGCAGLLGLGVLGVVVGTWLWSEQRPPSVWAGEQSYEATLLSDGGDGAADARVILDRLESLGVEGELVQVSRGNIVLRVEGVTGPDVIDAVVPQRSLALHLESESTRSLMPTPADIPNASPDIRFDHDYVRQSTVPTWIGPDAESLGPVLARIPAGAGVEPMLECGEAEWADSRGRECRVRVLESAPLVTGVDVVNAEVQMDEMAGMPQVLIEFGDDGARRFSDGTARGTGRRLAIVIDHEIVSFPVIMERIDGGRAVITPGAQPPGEQMAYAQAMAATFRSGALASPWEVASVRAVD